MDLGEQEEETGEKPRQQIASLDPLVYTQIITEPKSLEHDDITYSCSVGMYD
jgi:hypothetical protein